MAKLPHPSEIAIAVTFLVMNFSRLLWIFFDAWRTKPWSSAY